MEEVRFVSVEQYRYEELVSDEARIAILQEYVASRDGKYLDDDFIRLILGMEVTKAVETVEDKNS
jgi:hypothetical protein